MLSALHEQQDPAGGAFTTFVMSAVAAAWGRNALLHAPSLPSAWLLDTRLTAAAALASTPDDRSVCFDGARQSGSAAM